MRVEYSWGRTQALHAEIVVKSRGPVPILRAAVTIHTATDTTEFLDHLRAMRRAANTIRAYKSALTQYDTHLAARRACARSATFDDTAAFVARFAHQRPATAALKLAAIRSFHKWLTASGRRVDDPTILIGEIRVPDDAGRHAHPRDTIELVRARITRPRDRCAFALMFDCALRVSGAAGVHTSDVDLAAWKVTVTLKGGSRRAIPIVGDTARRDVLAQYLAVAGTGYLLPSRHHPGRPLHTTTLQRVVQAAATAAGLKPQEWTPHWLRHSRGDDLRVKGHDPFTIQRFLTHRKLSQTAHYMHPNVDDVTDTPAAAKSPLAGLIVQALQQLGAGDVLRDLTAGDVMRDLVEHGVIRSLLEDGVIRDDDRRDVLHTPIEPR